MTEQHVPLVNDPVHHPAHYKLANGVEVIDLTEQMNFNRGNAVKYIARAGVKDPSKEIEDLEKARWYLNREIERLRKGTLESQSVTDRPRMASEPPERG